MMAESILTSVKEYLSIPEAIKDFDSVLLTHINSVFAYLNQLGIGPVNGFEIKDASATWDEYIRNPVFNDVKVLMGAKVRQAFDPPTTGSVGSALDRQIEELEWRINAKQEVNEWYQQALF